MQKTAPDEGEPGGWGQRCLVKLTISFFASRKTLCEKNEEKKEKETA